MPGQGRMAKPASERARRNRDHIETQVIHVHSCPQPELPTFYVTVEARLVEYEWPPRTRDWWDMWGRSPLTRDFTENDWDALLDTAVLHAEFWKGNTKVAPELRLRTAKYGATPEDRARLRILFVQADKAEDEGVAPQAAYQRRPLAS